MNSGLPFLSPMLRESPAAAEQLQDWQARSNTTWAKNHRPDGTHSTIQERGRTTPQGEWITVPFSPTPFTCNNGGAWTVSFASYIHQRYMLVGKTMYVQVYIESSTIATAAPSQLFMRMPLNEITSVPYLVASARGFGTFAYDDNGTTGTGVILAGANSLRDIAFLKDMRGGVVFTVSAAMSLVGQFWCEIQ